MGTEIERRYLLTAEAIAYVNSNAKQVLLIEQVYSGLDSIKLNILGNKVISVKFGAEVVPVSTDKQKEFFELVKMDEFDVDNSSLELNEAVTARVRKTEDVNSDVTQYFLTIKAKAIGAVRQEFEAEWDGNNYGNLKAMGGFSLTKTRKIIPYKFTKIEIDFFERNGHGVSLKNHPVIAEIESKKELKLPDWMSGSKDVTEISPNNYTLALMKDPEQLNVIIKSMLV
jgi:CYTH domain-containing protein